MVRPRVADPDDGRACAFGRNKRAALELGVAERSPRGQPSSADRQERLSTEEAAVTSESAPDPRDPSAGGRSRLAE
eukprot:8314957-Lingulodinium_polyedra.AAC.1